MGKGQVWKKRKARQEATVLAHVPTYSHTLPYSRSFTLFPTHTLTELQEEMGRQKGETAGHVQARAWKGWAWGGIGRAYL